MSGSETKPPQAPQDPPPGLVYVLCPSCKEWYLEPAYYAELEARIRDGRYICLVCSYVLTWGSREERRALREKS